MDGMKPGYPRNTRFAGCSCFKGMSGFTVVELIAVIILLSILGVVAMGRMTSPTMFAPAIVTQSLIAEVRLAQQLATSRHDATISLTLDRAGARWRMRTVSSVDGLLRDEAFDVDGTSIVASSGAVSAGIDAATPLLIAFDHAGDLSAVSIGAAPGSPDAGVSVTVSGDTTRQLCIYPSGYANDSACG